MILVPFPFIFCRRPCTHKRHIALQNIEKLRELVQTTGANLFSDTCNLLSINHLVTNNSRIKVHLKHHTIRNTILCHEFFFSFLSIHIHGSEFVTSKASTILANACLFEKNWAGTLFFNLRSNNRNQNQRYNAAKYTSYNVNQSL